MIIPTPPSHLHQNTAKRLIINTLQKPLYLPIDFLLGTKEFLYTYMFVFSRINVYLCNTEIGNNDFVDKEYRN